MYIANISYVMLRKVIGHGGYTKSDSAADVHRTQIIDSIKNVMMK
jgi:hypothetical protein